MRFLSGIFILCFSIGLSPSALGQTMAYLPDGLHKLSKKELKERPLTLRGIPFYLDGEKIPQQELGQYVSDPAYALDYYGDHNGKIKAVVVRSSNATEKKAKMELIPAPRNPIDWRGRVAPEFERADLNGNKVNLSELSGKVVVLAFWRLKFQPSVKEIPELNRLKAYYAEEEVVFLASTRDIAPDINEFLKRQSFDFTILPNSPSLARRYGVMVYPMYFVIDQEGTVRFCQYEAHRNTRTILKEQIDVLLTK